MSRKMMEGRLVIGRRKGRKTGHRKKKRKEDWS